MGIRDRDREGEVHTMIQFAAEASEEPFVRISRALISVGYSLCVLLLVSSSLFRVQYQDY